MNRIKLSQTSVLLFLVNTFGCGTEVGNGVKDASRVPTVESGPAAGEGSRDNPANEIMDLDFVIEMLTFDCATPLLDNSIGQYSLQGFGSFTISEDGLKRTVSTEASPSRTISPDSSTPELYDGIPFDYDSAVVECTELVTNEPDLISYQITGDYNGILSWTRDSASGTVQTITINNSLIATRVVP